MRIVIDIPEEMYDWFNNGFPDEDDVERLWQVVKNGTPLPKGHGRLIDADKLPYEDIESIDGNIYMCVNAYDIDHAPTIIEESDKDDK